jgi:hypothetical protein
LTALLLAGRAAEARRLGERYLEQAEEEGLESPAMILRRALSLAEMESGNLDRAVKLCDEAVDHFRILGVSGMSLGVVHETRARIALAMRDEPVFRTQAALCAEQYRRGENPGDEPVFRTQAALCAEQYRRGENPVLNARYEGLMEEARRSAIRITRDLYTAIRGTAAMTLTDIRSASRRLFADCDGPEQRARRGLELLVSRSRARGGFLYTMQPDGPVLAAGYGDQTAPTGLPQMVRDYLTAELEDSPEVTVTRTDQASMEGRASEWISDDGERYRLLPLRSQSDQGYVVTGVAALRMESGESFSIPWDLSSVFSKILCDTGDAVPTRAAL